MGHRWHQRIPSCGVEWFDKLADDCHTEETWDFRGMWYRDEVFDAVAFDPPYVSVGGRSTSGINGMHAAYGMDGAFLGAAHGGPARLYSPVKLGYKNTKYLTKVVFLPTRNGGYWSDQGYEWYGGI